MNLYDLFNLTANATQFVNLSKNFADDKVFEQLLANQKTIIELLKGEDSMKILTHLIEKAHDTMEEVEWYGEKAMHYKADHKSLADVYNKIAEMHITIYDMLHKQMVELIDEHKRMGHTPPPEMLAIWDYEHKKLVKEFAEAKTLVDEYKKSY